MPPSSSVQAGTPAPAPSCSPPAATPSRSRRRLGISSFPSPRRTGSFRGTTRRWAAPSFRSPWPRSAPAELVKEIALGLVLVLSLAFIGVGVASGLAGPERAVMTLAAGFPLGAGLVTFSLFLLSWAGVRLDSILLLFVLTGWSAAVLLVCRRAMKSWASALARSLRVAELRNSRRLMVLILGLLALIGLSILLAVGLSYYEDDELAIWSTKGYGMVLEGTVWAGETWGAHGLSYPLNIPLLIGSFRLAAADHAADVQAGLSALLRLSAAGGRGFLAAAWTSADPHAALAMLFLATLPLIQFHSTLGPGQLAAGGLLGPGRARGDRRVRQPVHGNHACWPACCWPSGPGRVPKPCSTRPRCSPHAGAGGEPTRESGGRFLAALVASAGHWNWIWLAFALPSVIASHLGSAVDAFGQSLGIGCGRLGRRWARWSTAFAKTALHKERWAALLPVLAVLLVVALLRRREGQPRASGWLLLAGVLLMVEVVSIFFIRSYSRADFDILVGRAIHRHLIPAFLLMLVGASIGALRDAAPATRGPAEPGIAASDRCAEQD